MIDETIFVVLKQLIEYPSLNHEFFIIVAKEIRYVGRCTRYVHCCELSEYIATNGRIVDEWWIGNNLERRSVILIESYNLPGENRRKQWRAGVLTETLPEHHQKKNLTSFPDTELLGNFFRRHFTELVYKVDLYFKTSNKLPSPSLIQIPLGTLMNTCS